MTLTTTNSLSRALRFDRFFCFLVLVAIWVGCKSDPSSHATQSTQSTATEYIKFSGRTMGTSYAIQYNATSEIEQSQIDSILRSINLSVSTYIDTSTISKINNSVVYGNEVQVLDNGVSKAQHRLQLRKDQHFVTNFEKSKQVYSSTEGAFDPTVMPLVNYWGFGTTEKKAVEEVDSQKIALIMESVGLDKVEITYTPDSMIIVKPTDLSIDFSAIAKGYAVDYIANYLSDQGIQDYMVEIGGEVYAQGQNSKNKNWVIGINAPMDEAALNSVIETVVLDSLALASSGNYRNFYIVDGKKYGHEINPNTGYPEINDLLAISVVGPTTIEADAVATGLMIMGYDRALKYIDNAPLLEAVFFRSDKDGNILSEYSKGLSDLTMTEK